MSAARRAVAGSATIDPALVDSAAAAVESSRGALALWLRRDYRGGMGAWDLAIMGRKIAILIPRLLASSFVELQTVCALIALIIALFTHEHYRPFKTPSLNSLESLGLSCACAVLLFGLLFSAASPVSPSFNTRPALAIACMFVIGASIAVFCAGAIGHTCASHGRRFLFMI